MIGCIWNDKKETLQLQQRHILILFAQSHKSLHTSAILLSQTRLAFAHPNMGIIRDRLNAKLRRNIGTSSAVQTASPTASTPSQPPSTPPQPPAPPDAARETPPNRRASKSFSILRLRPKSTASSTHTKSTFHTTATKIKRVFHPGRPSSRVSNASLHVDDVPEPEPHLLPLPDGDPASLEHAADTPLTDGYVSLTVPSAWRAVRAHDAIYLLSGRGVGFVKAVRAVDACQVLLEVGRLSVMSHVVVRSSPVWVGCEATLEYSLDGGFGIGIARFHNGFEGGAVVFGFCAPMENKKLVMDAVQSVRASARVVKIPESEEENKEEKKEEKPDHQRGTKMGPQNDNQHEGICVIQ